MLRVYLDQQGERFMEGQERVCSVRRGEGKCKITFSTFVIFKVVLNKKIFESKL